MTTFRRRRSYGPRIRLTGRQVARVEALAAAAGLVADVDQSWTGSVYVSLHEVETDTTPTGEVYTCAGERVAKIRLSGHDEGVRQDSTHCVIGTKSECLARLWVWIADVAATHAASA